MPTNKPAPDDRPLVLTLTAFEMQVVAHDPATREVLKRLGARRGWINRSLWTLRVYGDDGPTLAAKFRALRDAGVGFADNTRDDVTPASRFDDLVQEGLLDGECRRG